jgi:signal transduction histidine kinase
MFKRLRKLEISLAAKCQLLFGSAVVLIISATLFVPWQRMEQLTEELNERAAAAIAHTAIAEHLLEKQNPQTHRPPAPTTQSATTRPIVTVNDLAVIPPRLILMADAHPDRVTPFERNALGVFTRNPRRPFYSRTYESSDGATVSYRYALALPPSPQCAQCHSVSDTPPPVEAAPADSDAEDPPPPTTAAAAILGFVSVDIPSQIDARQILLNRIFIPTAGLIAGTLAIVIFYLVTTRLILQPVRVLQETAEKVAEGDLNIRSDINTGDEFQVLSETFNTMLVNLKSSADQLRAVNKSLDLRLGQLAESNVALYESNRLKSEFLANVSHELRTPLNSILGFAELLRESTGAAADTKSTRYIQNILTAGHNLLDLINDLLDLAKIEAGRMEVRSEQLSMADLFEALTGVLKPLTEPKGLTIAAAVSPDVPIIETDSAKLQQILYNFLSNAIKFSPQSSSIGLTAELAGDHVRISVTDHGPGIDAAQQSAIFEKFRQIDGSVTRQHSGTGLGLAISKELTTLLGGAIGVRSAPGEGATFWITLPLKNVPGPADIRAKMVLS